MAARTSAHPEYGADVISLNEAACRLGMCPRTYVRGIHAGDFPGTVSGKTVVIPRQAYEKFLLEGRMPNVERDAA